MIVRRARRVLATLVVAVVLLAAVVVGGPAVIVWAVSRSHIYTEQDVPATDVTLVFGASMQGSKPSPYLQGRLDVAAALYRTGKTKVIIVSGTRDGTYNEPDGMKRALVAAGVPASRIVTDYAGDDTYSSCLHARDVYGVTSLIVVSQTYHVPRALAACRMLGIDAVGVGDTTQAHDARWRRYQLREVPAGMKLIFDVVTSRNTPMEAPSDEVRQALANG